MSTLLPFQAALLSLAGLFMLVSSVGHINWIFYGNLKQYLIAHLGKAGLDLLTGTLGILILGLSWKAWVQVL